MTGEGWVIQGNWRPLVRGGAGESSLQEDVSRSCFQKRRPRMKRTFSGGFRPRCLVEYDVTVHFVF